MDEKRREVLLKATKKLVDGKVSNDYILMSLGDLGVSEEEAKTLLNEVKPQKKREGKKPAMQKAVKPGQIAPKPGVGPKKEKGAIDETKAEAKKAAPKPAAPRPKPVIAVPARKTKTFIPKLKSGGREKIKEIIVDSPIGKKDWRELAQDPEKAIIDKLSRMEKKIEGLEKELAEQKKKRK